jgi:hypothetical protein
MGEKRTFLLKLNPYASITWIRYIKAIVQGGTIASIGYNLSRE